MLGRMDLGRWFGIPVYIHWSFWLLPLWIILAQPGGLPIGLVLAVVFAMFGCVVLHEFGHALAARLFGIGTRDVTLYPIGGVASLERISEKASEEFIIAIAGPLVNVVIAALLALGLAAGMMLGAAVDSTLVAFVSALITLNIIMIVFNLIPAFPLDGGRIFRAALAGFLPRLQATRVAVAVGSALALALVGAGVLAALGVDLPFASPMLIVIGWFVYMAGQGELRQLEYRARHGARAPAFIGPEAAAADAPPWAKPPVTIYVYDPQTGQWVRNDADRYTRV